MSLAIHLDLLTYSLLISILMLAYIVKNYSFSENSIRLFAAILISTSCVIILEIGSWAVDRIDNPVMHILNYIFISVFYSCEYIPGFFWLFYFDYKITDNFNAAKKRGRFYLIPGLIIIGIVFYSLKTGFLFSIHPGNIYNRGPGVYVVASVYYIQYIIAFFLAIKNRRNVNAEIVLSIAAYFTLPILAMIIQLAFFGQTLIWPMFTLANMIAFILLEKDVMLRDPLTGIYTRGEFQQKVFQLIKRRKPFTLIMFDLDKFKEINDSLGHQAGDKALKELVELILIEKRKTDLFCRYGGDEFMILMRSDNPDVGIYLKERIEHAVIIRNNSSSQGFSLQMSFGILHVPRENTRSLQTILEEVDQQMYLEKTQHRKKY